MEISNPKIKKFKERTFQVQKDKKKYSQEIIIF